MNPTVEGGSVEEKVEAVKEDFAERDEHEDVGDNLQHRRTGRKEVGGGVEDGSDEEVESRLKAETEKLVAEDDSCARGDLAESWQWLLRLSFVGVRDIGEEIGGE